LVGEMGGGGGLCLSLTGAELRLDIRCNF